MLFRGLNQTHLAHLPHDLTQQEETTKRKGEQDINGAYEEVKTNERDRKMEKERGTDSTRRGRKRERRSGLICTWLLSKESRLITG